VNADTFLEQFAHLAEAPNGIPKLRELILQLAVRGKLVSQHPNDEPASELLKRIQVERERLAAVGEIKRSRRTIAKLAVPLEVPTTWCCEPLGDIARIETGKRMKGGARSEGVISLGGEHLRSGGSVDYSVPRCVSESFYCQMPSGHVELFDTLMVKDGATTGKTALVEEMPGDGRAAVNEHVFIIRRVGDLNPRLLFFFVRALSQEFIAVQSKGIIGGVGKTVVSNMPFPLPPLAEQKRIVVKVDELMALCDDLETKQQEMRTTQISLNRACLQGLTSPNGEGQTKAWQRLRDHFDDLYTIPETVAELRQAILQLAVMGRLVPQDPNDEPASELLKKIQAEKQRLIAEGVIRKPKPLPPIDPDEIPYELARGWDWVRFSNLGYFLGGGTPSKSNPSLWGGSIPWVSPKDMKVLRISESQDFVTDAALSASSIRMIPEGALLMVVRGMILQHSFPVAIAECEVAVNQDMKALVPYVGGMEDFLLKLLQGNKLRVLDLVERSTHGTCRLSSDRLFGLCVPLPPAPEQKRIVAKVDQLMTLCDDLEAKLQQTQSDADNLLTAIVRELTEAAEGIGAR